MTFDKISPSNDDRRNEIEKVQKFILFARLPLSEIEAAASLYLDAIQSEFPLEVADVIAKRRESEAFNDSFLRAIREGAIFVGLQQWLDDESLIEDYIKSKDISNEIDPLMFSRVRSDFYYFSKCQSM